MSAVRVGVSVVVVVTLALFVALVLWLRSAPTCTGDCGPAFPEGQWSAPATP